MTVEKAIEKAAKKMVQRTAAVCKEYGVTDGEQRAEILKIILDSARLSAVERRIAERFITREIARAKDDAISDKEFARHWGHHD